MSEKLKKCYPDMETWAVDSYSVLVNMQSFLNHTALRLATLQRLGLVPHCCASNNWRQIKM